MKKCSKKNQGCLVQIKKCNDCKFYSCKNKLNKMEKHQKEIDQKTINYIKKQMPEKCQKCNLYRITDIRKQKVYCPYMIGNSCIIK